MKRIAVLGSTGSIGRQTLAVARAFPHDVAVVGLAAASQVDLLLQQAREFSARLVSCLDAADRVAASLPQGCRRVTAEEVATHPEVDLVMAASVGTSGLRPVLAALEAGKAVALANKEAIVAAGGLLLERAQESGGELLPVDSEPSALWQCLRGEDGAVSRLIITASGGALRDCRPEELAGVTPEQALRHPTWSMGRKITIDSATLMNKAFEVIEAHWLFGTPWERIQVVLHPESIVHSMIEFEDGSVKAQLGVPDMRLPIQYALFHPERRANASLPTFNPSTAGSLTFRAMEMERYPCFALALEAGRQGGTCPAVLSAADEVAVDLFLERRIRFTEMPGLIGEVLERHEPVPDPGLEEILAADAWAREQALSRV